MYNNVIIRYISVPFWKKAIGRSYAPSLHKYRVCCRRVTVKNYKYVASYKLSRNAVPSFFCYNAEALYENKEMVI